MVLEDVAAQQLDRPEPQQIKAGQVAFDRPPTWGQNRGRVWAARMTAAGRRSDRLDAFRDVGLRRVARGSLESGLSVSLSPDANCPIKER